MKKNYTTSNNNNLHFVVNFICISQFIIKCIYILFPDIMKKKYTSNTNNKIYLLFFVNLICISQFIINISIYILFPHIMIKNK